MSVMHFHVPDDSNHEPLVSRPMDACKDFVVEDVSCEATWSDDRTLKMTLSDHTADKIESASNLLFEIGINILDGPFLVESRKAMINEAEEKYKDCVRERDTFSNVTR